MWSDFLAKFLANDLSPILSPSFITSLRRILIRIVYFGGGKL